jgi:hypothetical protein
MALHLRELSSELVDQRIKNIWFGFKVRFQHSAALNRSWRK